jgi:hypothetical protein
LICARIRSDTERGGREQKSITIFGKKQGLTYIICSASGLGEATTRELVSRGANVAVSCVVNHVVLFIFLINPIVFVFRSLI